MTKLNDLTIYKKALDLIVRVYKLINANPILMKDFSLCDQLKRACISIAANISEGYMRTQKQFLYYLDVSSGSSNEMITLLTVVELVYKINTKELIEEYLYLGKQIKAFSKRFKMR